MVPKDLQGLQMSRVSDGLECSVRVLHRARTCSHTIWLPTADPLKWKLVEKHPGRAIEKIEKIDNFQGHPAPLLRFRSTFRGPCVGECFGSFIMDYDQRKKWDAQIAQVYEAYPIDDLDSANIAQGFGKYGDCSKLGIGYCKTKAIPGISPREQLTLCGIQDFVDGSCIIWGVEMEEWHDHLLPPGTRVARAKSHLFATTMVPTSEDTFDVEYVLQLEIGGKIPTWLTAPIVIENIKNCFKTAKPFFEGDGVKEFLENKKKEDTFMHKLSLLMTP